MARGMLRIPRARPEKIATTQPHIAAYQYKKDTSSYSTQTTALCLAGSSLGALLLIWMVGSGAGILNTDSGGRARLAHVAVLIGPTFGSGKAEDADPRGAF